LRRGVRRGEKRDSWSVGHQDDTRCDGDAEPTRQISSPTAAIIDSQSVRTGD
jgi:hypothetical protein